MKEKIILVGGGGHCKSCIDVIEQEEKFEIIGIVDVNDKIGEDVLNYKIIGDDDDLPYLVNEYNNFIITIGQLRSPELRIKIFNTINKLGGKLPVIISPYAYVSKHSKVNEGTIIMHYAIVNAAAEIGKNCIINSNALIEHDALIGDHCHISTASVVNGGVKIGNGTFYGSGAVSKQYIFIPENSFIKANTIIK